MSKVFVTLACATALAVPLGGTVAFAQDAPVIALSNSFYGNTWRRQMVDAFTEQAEVAKAEGLISDYVVLNGDGTVAQQNSQLAELVLRGVDAIAINAASETALKALTLPDDLRGRSMLGDTGANAAGAMVGLALVERSGLRGRLAVLAVTAGLTVLSEKVSFSKVIDDTPVLRRVDQWGRG